MKTVTQLLFITAILFTFSIAGLAQTQPIPEPEKYILENDVDVAKEEPGTHKGGGQTIGYSFFEGAKDYKTAFRKRTLKAGSAIGYHLQKDDEIYYVLTGNGVMQMNGKTFPVKPGDAILTRPGSSHGIAPNKNSDMTILIVYQKK